MKRVSAVSFSVSSLILSLALAGRTTGDLELPNLAGFEAIFPQMVLGESALGEFEAEIIIISPTNLQAGVRLDFFADGASSEGPPVVGTRERTVPPHLVARLKLPGAGELTELVQGWARIVSDQPVLAYYNLRLVRPSGQVFQLALTGNGEAVTAVTAEVRAVRIDFADETTGGLPATAVSTPAMALVNLEPFPIALDAELTIRSFSDPDQVFQTRIDLDSRQRIAQPLAGFFPGFPGEGLGQISILSPDGKRFAVEFLDTVVIRDSSARLLSVSFDHVSRNNIAEGELNVAPILDETESGGFRALLSPVGFYLKQDSPLLIQATSLSGGRRLFNAGDPRIVVVEGTSPTLIALVDDLHVLNADVRTVEVNNFQQLSGNRVEIEVVESACNNARILVDLELQTIVSITLDPVGLCSN